MGVSAGRVTVDDGEGMGGIGIRAGKTTDDDEDLRRDYGDHGGGGAGELSEGELEYHQAIEKIRIIEQVRENLAYTRPSRLRPRQVESGSSSIVSDSIVVSTALNSIGSSTSALLDTSLASVPLTSLLTDLTSSTTLLTISGTNSPPPSPVETSSGMSIPPTTRSTSSLSSSITPRPQNTGSTTRPYTTITSYLTTQTSRNNGTTTSNTRSTGSTTLTSSQPSGTVTVDGTIIVYTYSTSTQELSSSSSTGGGGYVAPTSSTSASAVPTSTTTPSDNSPPVSPSLLGGVLGGVAGIAFILVAILYLVRRHKRAVAAQQRDDAGYGGPLEGVEGDQMMQRSGVAPFALAGSFFRNPRTPRASQSSDTPTVPSTSEVGFYKVSGRKLAPVLGGPRPGYGSTRSAGGSSYYPDDDGITVASTPSVVGPSRYSSMTASSTSPTGSTAPMNFSSAVPPAPPSTHMPPHIGSSMAPPPPRIQEEAVESDNESTEKLPRPPPFPRQLSAVSVGSVGKDGVGRSLPSHDGSRASRFTEDIV